MEEWKRIYIDEEITKYEISNLGRCRRIDKLTWKTKGILKPKFNKSNGYYSYDLMVNGKHNYRYCHRLVATYFLPNPNNLPQVNHKNGDKSDNTTNNLEWCDQFYNMRHCVDNNLTSINKPVILYSLKGNYVGEFNSITEAVKFICKDCRKNYGIDFKVLDVREDNIYTQQLGYQWRLKYGDNRKVIDIEDTCSKQDIPIVQTDLNGNFIRTYDKIHEAYIELGKRDNGVISQVCKGNRPSYLGYKWFYLNKWVEMKNK